MTFWDWLDMQMDWFIPGIIVVGSALAPAVLGWLF